ASSFSGGTPAYTYSWSSLGGNTANPGSLTAGGYTVTVTDGNGCTTTANTVVNQPAASLSATAGAVTNVACFGNSTGSAAVTAAGGTSPYAYAWSPIGGNAMTGVNLTSTGSTT